MHVTAVVKIIPIAVGGAVPTGNHGARAVESEGRATDYVDTVCQHLSICRIQIIPGASQEDPAFVHVTAVVKIIPIAVGGAVPTGNHGARAVESEGRATDYVDTVCQHLSICRIQIIPGASQEDPAFVHVAAAVKIIPAAVLLIPSGDHPSVGVEGKIRTVYRVDAA